MGTSSRVGGGGGGGGSEWTFYWDPKRVPRRPKNWYASRRFSRACGGSLRPDLLRPPSEHSESPWGRLPPSPALGLRAQKEGGAFLIHLYPIYLVPVTIRRYWIICAGVHSSNLPDCAFQSSEKYRWFSASLRIYHVRGAPTRSRKNAYRNKPTSG